MNRGRNPIYDNSSMIARQEYLAGGSPPSDVLGAVGQVVQTMGLFGKARGLMDEAQIRTRGDDIAKAMGDSGDVNSIPGELTQGRIGTIALAGIVDAKAKTQEGKLSLAQNARKLATIDLQNIQGGIEQAKAARTAADSLMAQAAQAMQSGDSTAAQGFESQANQNYDLAAKHIESTSHNTAMPYTVRHIGGGKFEELFTGAPDGKPQPTGRSYSADQIVSQAQKALQDTPSYLKMIHQHTAAAMEHNVEVSRNPDKWMEAKVLDKDGQPTKKSREFVPFLNVAPGQPVQTGYYDPKDQKAYNSVEELMAAGFSAPESKAGSAKSDKLALDTEKAAAAQAHGEARLGLMADAQRARQEASEARVGAAGAGVQLQRERLALEREKADQSDQGKVSDAALKFGARAAGLAIHEGGLREVVKDEDGKYVTGPIVGAGHPKYDLAMSKAQEYLDGALKKNSGSRTADGKGPGLYSNGPAATPQVKANPLEKYLPSAVAGSR